MACLKLQETLVEFILSGTSAAYVDEQELQCMEIVLTRIYLMKTALLTCLMRHSDSCFYSDDGGDE